MVVIREYGIKIITKFWWECCYPKGLFGPPPPLRINERSEYLRKQTKRSMKSFKPNKFRFGEGKRDRLRFSNIEKNHKEKREKQRK